MRRLVLSLLLLFLIFSAPSDVIFSVVPYAEAEAPFARRLHAPGLHKMGRVHAGLFRGSDPEGEEGFQSLRKLGIRTVISLRSDPDDPELLKKYRMRAIHIPMRPSRPPRTSQQEKFLNAVTDTRLHPVFVHCARGRDRTGVMMALYRIRVEGWSKERAIAEMRRYGHDPEEYPALERFIRRLDISEKK